VIETEHHIGQGQVLFEFTHWVKRCCKPFKTEVLDRSRLMAFPTLNLETMSLGKRNSDHVLT